MAISRNSPESQNANVYIYGPGSLTINNGNYGAGIYLDEFDLTIAQDATVNIISETDQSMGISLAGRERQGAARRSASYTPRWQDLQSAWGGGKVNIASKNENIFGYLETFLYLHSQK